MLINVLYLGLVDYQAALQLQHSLVELRKQGQIADTLILLEHPPVITLGRNAKKSNLLASPETLAQRGVQLIECDRGGDVTFHGPGQLVGYPIFDLRGFAARNGQRKSLGAVDFVRLLEEALIRTCANFAVPAGGIPGLTGVWVEGARGEQAKIAAMGLHISRGVTSHGFAMNVNNDLNYFNLIVPCGIASKPVTSLSKEVRDPEGLKMEQVIHAVARNFGRVFARQMLWVENLDSLTSVAALQPSDTPLKVPAELRALRGEDEIFLA
jgi:lipoyl(octanoyl) transferase